MQLIVFFFVFVLFNSLKFIVINKLSNINLNQINIKLKLKLSKTRIINCSHPVRNNNLAIITNP